MYPRCYSFFVLYCAVLFGCGDCGLVGAEAPGTPNSQGSRRNSGNFSSPTMAGLHGHGHGGHSSGGGGSGGSVDGSVPGMLSSPPSAPHSHSPSSTQSKAVFKNRRRRMVADCKALRAQVRCLVIAIIVLASI